MRFSLFFFIYLSIALTNIAAQRVPPRTRPTAPDMNARAKAAAERNVRELREMEIERKTVAKDNTIVGIPPIYRKPTKEETGALEPPKEVVDKYSEFLRKQRTGVVTLNADERCGTDDGLVSAEQSCASFQFPGGGTAYSFRVESYRAQRLSDLKLAKNILVTDSFGQQGILVDLGEQPIEDLDLKSPGIHFLANFKPAESSEEFRTLSRELETGMNKDGFLYRLALIAKANHTFGLRSIAYEGQSPRSINGVAYDEFGFDKRDDVIIVFKIADIAQNGNVTIVWRELRRGDSPKIKSK